MSNKLKTYTNNSVNINKLDLEIKVSGFVTNYDGLSLTDDQLDVHGDAIVDEVSLDTLVSNHDITSDQLDLDFIKYKKRASVKDDIMAQMASNNMARVRAGVWTVEQLIGLTQDAELKLILDDVSTLSYELAVSKVQAATNVLMTEEIKNEWITMLVTHFYN